MCVNQHLTVETLMKGIRTILFGNTMV